MSPTVKMAFLLYPVCCTELDVNNALVLGGLKSRQICK